MRPSLEHLSAVVGRVVADYDVREAYVFGSFARGEQEAASDIDLRLACGPSMTYGVLLEIAERLEAELGCAVDLITNPPERMRPAFREHILREEVLLYEAA